jgi:hypothetical protein
MSKETEVLKWTLRSSKVWETEDKRGNVQKYAIPGGPNVYDAWYDKRYLGQTHRLVTARAAVMAAAHVARQNEAHVEPYITMPNCYGSGACATAARLTGETRKDCEYASACDRVSDDPEDEDTEEPEAVSASQEAALL